MEEMHSPPKGYPQVATFMANNPEMMVVRRFGGLNVRNLLYLQAELIRIEKELLECEIRDAESKVGEEHDRRRYPRDYLAVFNSRNEVGRNNQWLLIHEMRAKLKEYSTLAPIPAFGHRR